MFFYRALIVLDRLLSSIVFGPFAPLVDKKYSEGIEERHGKIKNITPGGVWIHAVSVGEVQSALGLIARCCATHQDMPIYLSTVTETGGALARRMAPQGVQHFYAPWDSPAIQRRTFDILQPRCVIIMETELWPIKIAEAVKRNVPVFVVNGRISPKSFGSYRKSRFFWKPLLAQVSWIFARSDEDVSRFIELGADSTRCSVTGEGKIDNLLAKRDGVEPKLPGLRTCFRLIAGSTHEGEEESVLRAFATLTKDEDGQLILVPRHPIRTKDIVSLVGKITPQLRVCTYSEPTGCWDVMVIDTIGLLTKLYSLCDAAFVGGSLVPKGCQNVYEPACFGVPFAVGPHVEDFAAPVQKLKEFGLCHTVTDEKTLTEFWQQIRGNNIPLEGAKRKTEAWLSTLGGASKAVWDKIQAYL